MQPLPFSLSTEFLSNMVEGASVLDLELTARLTEHMAERAGRPPGAEARRDGLSSVLRALRTAKRLDRPLERYRRMAREELQRFAASLGASFEHDDSMAPHAAPPRRKA